MSGLPESDEVHAYSVLGNVEETKHEEQIVSADVTDFDCPTMQG